MNLTDKQRTIIQTTFRQITDADRFTTRFYNRLFEIDPSTRSLFKGDREAQQQKLQQALAVVVNGLDNLDIITVAVERLGQRHVTYGVTIAHWDSVGEALLWALAETLGDAFTAEVFMAWATAYRLIAQTAIAASYPIAQSELELE